MKVVGVTAIEVVRLPGRHALLGREILFECGSRNMHNTLDSALALYRACFWKAATSGIQIAGKEPHETRCGCVGSR